MISEPTQPKTRKTRQKALSPADSATLTKFTDGEAYDLPASFAEWIGEGAVDIVTTYQCACLMSLRVGGFGSMAAQCPVITRFLGCLLNAGIRLPISLRA